jgi:hypothetical protein
VPDDENARNEAVSYCCTKFRYCTTTVPCSMLIPHANAMSATCHRHAIAFSYRTALASARQIEVLHEHVSWIRLVVAVSLSCAARLPTLWTMQYL